MKSPAAAPVRDESPNQKTAPKEDAALQLDIDVVGTETKKTSLPALWLLWNARRTLLRVVLCGLVCSIIVAFLIPTRYESTVRLMPPDQGGGPGLAMAAVAIGASGLGNLASDFLGLKNTSDLFVGILSSRTVQDHIIDQFQLQKVYGDRYMVDARKDLAEHTNVSVDRKSQIISISVTDRNANRAAAIAQAYVDQLNQLVADVSTSSARRERIFLEGRLRTVNQDLENAEKEFSQFASRSGAIDVKEQGKAMVSEAATLQGQLIATQSEYEGLKQIYTENNIRVRTLKSRIEELQRQLQKIAGASTTGSDTSGEAKNNSTALYPAIRQLPLLGVTYADLYRRTLIQEAVLETLTKEYEMAKVQEAKELPTVKVLDAPNVPDKKSFPPRTVIILFGTCFALLCGASFLMICKWWADIDKEDPRKEFVSVFLLEVTRTARWTRPKSLERKGEEWNRKFWTNREE